MDVERFLVYALGVGLVAAALVVLWSQTPLGDVVPFAVLVAALLIVVGLGFMLGTDRFGRDAIVVDRRRW